MYQAYILIAVLWNC